MTKDSVSVVYCGIVPDFHTSFPTYTGFEPIHVAYCGEDLVGIVEFAARNLIRVRLDSYPQTAVLERGVSVYTSVFMRGGYLQKDDNGQVSLSESGRNVAIDLMKKLYELYHEPFKSQDQNCNALCADTQMAVSRCFRDVRTPLVQEIPKIQNRCKEKYKADFALLFKARGDLKKRFKLKELSEAAYKSARKELTFQIDALREQERMTTRSEVEHFLQALFGILPHEAWQYAEGLPECKAIR